MINHIFAFGDSHVRIFDSDPDINALYCGPATCSSLSRRDSHTNAGNNISDALEDLNLSDSLLLFNFGEIDTRIHFLRRSVRSRDSLSKVILHGVRNYVDFVKSVAGTNKVGLILPFGSGLSTSNKFPSYYREEIRNYIILLFNFFLKNECCRMGWTFSDITHITINNSLLTNKSYLSEDGIHLKGYPDISPDIRGLVKEQLSQSSPAKNLINFKSARLTDLFHIYSEISKKSFIIPINSPIDLQRDIQYTYEDLPDRSIRIHCNWGVVCGLNSIKFNYISAKLFKRAIFKLHGSQVAKISRMDHLLDMDKRDILADCITIEMYKFEHCAQIVVDLIQPRIEPCFIDKLKYLQKF